MSEDIDLFAYNKFPGRKFKLPHIEKLLDRFKTDFSKFQIQLIEDSDATLFLDDVKVQMRAEHQFHGPKLTEKLGTNSFTKYNRFVRNETRYSIPKK